MFTDIEEYLKDYHPHLMIYGFNGTGKTTLAGKTGLRTVLLDCGDSGVVTLRKGVDKSKLKIVRVKSINQYLDVMVRLNRLANKIDLLVVDTLSGLRSIAVREVKGKKAEMNIRKWGTVASKVIECISETRQFPKDVIYLAQQKKKGKLGSEEDDKVISPSLSDGVLEFVSANIDWVGRLYVEDGKRKLSFILEDKVVAKDRGDIFPKIITLGGGPDKSPYPQIRERIIKQLCG